MSTLFTRSLLCLALLGSILAGLLPAPVHAQRVEPLGPVAKPVVQAVLFYSPTCPHCHEVINNVLPPLAAQYGDQLEIIGIDVSQDWGQALYQAAIRTFNIGEDRRGVPALIVGDRVLVGSGEIPAIFPGLIEIYLAGGGMAWPAIPELQQMMAAQEAAAQEAAAQEPVAQQPAPETVTEAGSGTVTAPAETASAPAEAQAPLAVAEDVQSLAAAPPPTWRDRFNQDPTGNSLSLVVLAGMVIGLAAVLRPRPKGGKAAGSGFAQGGWLIPVLAVAGLGVAGYLAYIETTLAQAVCGPVGDCNAVQQSDYARLFGIPIAFYGLAGYLSILALWAAQRWVKTPVTQQAGAGIFVIAVIGVLFSIYLTFLEPFVIGATCIWCLSSAVIMTALLLLSAGWGNERVKG